jgi:hypothetical protein
VIVPVTVWFGDCFFLSKGWCDDVLLEGAIADLADPVEEHGGHKPVPPGRNKPLEESGEPVSCSGIDRPFSFCQLLEWPKACTQSNLIETIH